MLKHLFSTLLLAAIVFLSFHAAAQFSFDERAGELVLLRDGKPWLATVVAPYDAGRRDETYKVFTHIYDFAGAAPITKGGGGKYPHHRGMFIGWKKTSVDGRTFNPWEMSDAYQQHAAWIEKEAGADRAVQSQKVEWRANDGTPLVDEVRRIGAMQTPDGLRVFDFDSTLSAPAGVGKVELRGDVQHAGMHVRLANEVSEHEETTEYIIPEGAVEEANVEVKGVWWVCCSAVVQGKRWWVLHMTHPSLSTGVPTYSVRKYARLGAFFEPNLEAGKPLDLRFRIVVSEKPLDRSRCAALYAEYGRR